MSKNNQIDLIEFPASSPDELKAVSQFFNSVFGWQFKEWDEAYYDTHGSGVTQQAISLPPGQINKDPLWQ